jgi:Polysaccharide lyase 14
VSLLPEPGEIMFERCRNSRQTVTFLFVFGAVALFMARMPHAAEEESRSYPRLITGATKADPQALAELKRKGAVLFRDDFESPDSLEKYFEIRGLKQGNAKLVTGGEVVRSGKGAIQFTARARDGRESGVGASGWLGPEGYDRIHFRRYIKFDANYDQGNLNHVGGGLAGVAGTNRYSGMGGAGVRPRGNDRFTSSFEPWRDWGRYPAPGYMFLYTYWMDMKQDRDGNYWGNMLGPDKDDRISLDRDRWYCLEHMIQVNDVGQANGELAAWIDGELYLHFQGLRWRSDENVRLKRFNLGVYVHRATQDNTVWYDDVVLSTGYVGPENQP